MIYWIIIKNYLKIQLTRKWQKKWVEMGIYCFDRKDRSRPVFTIDTPPPYPSGNFHMGNVLNWTYIDALARYKRMLGYNVLFPQGWDCHGLPTEVQTEEAYKIKKDYLEVLVKSQKTIYHVDDTWENYDKISKRISERFEEWKSITKS